MPRRNHYAKSCHVLRHENMALSFCGALRGCVKPVALAVLAVASWPMPALADFAMDSLPVQAADVGYMERSHQPAPYKSGAAFGRSDSDRERYEAAELLVDLAYKPVTQRGTGQVQVVDGFGDGVPFATAMGMILPTGWQLYREKKLEKEDIPELISFSGGVGWPEVLAAAGERYALRFHIDWYDRTVMLSKGRPGAAHVASSLKVIAEPPKITVPVHSFAPPAANAHMPAPALTSTVTDTPQPAQPGIKGASTSTPAREESWLSGRRISIAHNSPAMTLADVASQLERQGIKVVTSEDLGRVRYDGRSIRSLRGELALKSALSPYGLDFAVGAEPAINIRASKPKTFRVKRSPNPASSSAIRAFWSELEREVNKRLMPCLPLAGGSEKDCSPKKSGSYAVSQENGTVTVNAPEWLAADIEKYLSKMQEPSKDDMRALVKGAVFRN